MVMLPPIALLKQVVLTGFFLLYCGLLAWTFGRRKDEMEDLRWLPLRDEEEHHG